MGFFIALLHQIKEVNLMKVSIFHNGKQEIVHLNRRRAIRYKCIDCGGGYSGGISNCKLINCQLFPYRSGKGKQNPMKRAKAIRDYCLKNCMLDQKYEVQMCPCKDCSLYPYRHTRVDRSVEIK